MMDLRNGSKKIAKLILLGLTLNIVGSASAMVNATAGGSFNEEMLNQKTEKEAVNKFYAAFLKNQVEKERLEEQEKQNLRHQEGYNPNHPALPKIFEIESMKILMRYFDNSNVNEKIASGAYFSSNVYNDLNVFPDPTNSKRVTVFSDFSNLTNTMSGKLGLLEMLSNPLSDIEKLRERQKVLEHLCKNDALYKELDASLKKFGKAEKSLLYFMKTKDDGSNRDDFRRYFDDNTNSGKNGLINDALWYGGLLGRTIPSVLCAAYMMWSVYQLAQFPGNFIPFIKQDKSTGQQGLNAKINNLLMIGLRSSKFENLARDYFFTNQYLRLALILASYYGMKKSWNKWVAPRAEMGKRFQSCMIDVTDVVDATREIAEAISRNDTLSTIIPGYKDILSAVSGQDDGEFKAILDLFDSSSFKGEANTIKPKGQIFKAFKVMCEKADKFTEFTRFVSRLDATMAVVKALRSSAKNHAKYSIPKFVKTEDGKPCLSAKKFWHPTLDPRKVVTNDIELGKTYRNVILTGANAGGKTTWIQSLALVAILAQTFGIVPAEYAMLTPFSLVIVDTKAETEIGKKSTFQDEISKLVDARKQIKSLNANQFALYIVDEPLKGSDAAQCASESYDAIKGFGLQTNAIVVVATHHVETLSKLGDQTQVDEAIKGIFENFKVDSRLYESTKYPDAYLHHTYKVIPGVSTEKVAKHLLDLAYKDSEMVS